MRKACLGGYSYEEHNYSYTEHADPPRVNDVKDAQQLIYKIQKHLKSGLAVTQSMPECLEAPRS